MKIKLLIIFIIFAFTSAVFAAQTFAQEPTGLANIQYPVEELDNCKSEADCKTYCDEPKNAEDCFAFAEKNNLMSKEEIKVAKKFLSGDIKGPGGCEGKNACEEYCNNIDHIDECIAFAEENNLIPPEELEEAKKVQAAIKRGVKPPPCGNKKQCDVYCDEPEHMEECIAFGIEAGFIQGKELEDVQKMLQAVKRGVKPPPCKGKKACDEYCNNPDNMEVCMNFAMEAGFMTEQEKTDSQKMLQALKKGVKPPNCRGREECDVYCSTEEHFEECANFAEAAGFMTAKEAVMARKTKGKGPGGCKSKEQCEAFCNNPDNRETCFNFAKDNGMIPEDGMMPPGEGQFGPVSPGFPSELEGKCTNAQECKAYCENNPEECKNFQPGPGVVNPAGQMMPPQAGPGGCKNPDECKSYCESNPDECKNFGTGGEGQFAPGTTGPTGPCEGEQCQQQPPSGQQPPSDGSVQPPPPPPPPTSFLKPQSFLGAALYIIAKALYSVR